MSSGAGTVVGGFAVTPTAAELAARLGLPLDAICKLDANESPFGPTPAAQAALAALLEGGAGLAGPGRYPDALATDLRAALAEQTQVPTEQIFVGNGGDEVLVLLAHELLRPGDEAVVCEPTFGVYAHAVRLCGARLVDVGRDAQFAVPTERLLEAIKPRTRLVFLCSPNNPTGTALPRATVLAALAKVEALATEAPDGTAPLLVVDEAYYEIGALVDDPTSWTAAPLVAAGRRLVVVRTFSKVYGLAGLRVGYGLCPPQVAAALRARKELYNVNSAAQVAALAALTDGAWLRAQVATVVAERTRLAAGLAALPGLHVWPSAANFLLVQVQTPPGRDALWEALAAQGILVRRLSGPRLDETLRITVGTPAQNDRVVAALGVALSAAKAEEASR